MATDADPIVGNWYQNIDRGEKFEVIDVDEEKGLVEIQYNDGDTDEIDLDEWYEMEIEPLDEEDWDDDMDDDLEDDDEDDDEDYSDLDEDEDEDDWEDSPKRGSKKKEDDWDEDED